MPIRSYHVALISESKHLPFPSLSPVAAALSKQMIRDVAPMWRITATVTPFQALSAVPAGYYPITVKDDIQEPGAAGYHTDANNQPYSLIQYAPDWSVTASHELIEMIGDPWGNRLYPGVIQGKRVMVLEELCDPPENFSYTIDGVAVSDFVVPEYFSAAPRASHLYSFLGKLTAPYQVADGGYISWLDPADNHWWQMTNFGGLQVSDLGPASELTAGFKTLREAVDNYGAKNHAKLGKVKPAGRLSLVGPF